MIALTVGNCYTTITGLSPADWPVVRRITDIVYTSWRRDRFGNPEEVERRVSLFYPVTGGRAFPTGLLSQVLDVLAEAGLDVTVVDPADEIEWISRPAYLPQGAGVELRDYQIEAVDRALADRRGILAIPTGGGKTVTSAALIWRANVSPVLVVVPRLELLNQTYAVYQNLLPLEVSRIGGKHRDGSGDVVVATPTAYLNYVENQRKAGAACPIADPAMVIPDEAHHINLGYRADRTTQWYQILMGCQSAAFRIALTATPGEPDGAQRRLLEAATGPVIYHRTTSDMVDEGRLVPADIEVHRLTHNSRLRWPAAYEQHILSGRRNGLVAQLTGIERAAGRSVLIIVDRVEQHGDLLHRLLPGSIYLHGSVDLDVRTAELARFKRGGGVLIGTIFGEGVDIPMLDTVVMAAGGKSVRQVIQRIGRALRPSAGKDRAKIIDFYDADGGVLERHSNQRLEVYRSERAFTVRMIGQGG